MQPFVRFVRALAIFGLIFASYMTQFALLKVFRRYAVDPSTGRELALVPHWLERRRTRLDARNARRLLRGMLRLRGVYIKLGQVLSVMGGFLPAIYAKELEALQDAVPPRPFEELEASFTASLGRTPNEVYASIERTPLAAASLGQVHRATGHDGRALAVKVLYPGIRDVVRVDMKVVRIALRVYKWFSPVENIETVHTALVDLLRRETDYMHEASCMVKMAAQFADADDILFPEVVEAATSSDVLTMTFMEGVKITNFAALDTMAVDRTALATRLVQCFYEQVFVHRFFHADPHPGNFFVQAGETSETPNIVILDFGAISEVSDEMVRGMVKVLRAFFEQEDGLLMEGIEQMGFISETGDRTLLEQTIKTYFAKLLNVKDLSAGMLMRADESELRALIDPEVARRELQSLMRSVRYPDGWFYVERATLMLFWLAGQIDPELDSFQIGFPYILPLIAESVAEGADA